MRGQQIFRRSHSCHRPSRARCGPLFRRAVWAASCWMMACPQVQSVEVTGPVPRNAFAAVFVATLPERAAAFSTAPLFPTGSRKGGRSRYISSCLRAYCSFLGGPCLIDTHAVIIRQSLSHAPRRINDRWHREDVCHARLAAGVLRVAQGELCKRQSARCIVVCAHHGTFAWRQVRRYQLPSLLNSNPEL